MFFLLVVDFILAKNGGCFFYLGGGCPRNHALCMIDLYSHTLCIVTENINTTYTQIIKYMC
jgi:hypothetical protein